MRANNEREIRYSNYHDRVLGAWIGKSLGGTIGAPFEGHKILGDKTVGNCWPASIMPNDDLDIQVVWLELLEERGPDITSKDLVEMWRERCWYNFCEYGFFLHNVQRGLSPPLSGEFNNIYFRESMGCPIRAEIWGLIAPGNPRLASAYAKLDGELDHINNSVWAEQFWAACISEAFFADNLADVLDVGRSVIPTDSDIHRISYEVPELCAAHRDWRRVWKELVRRHGHRDGSKVQINTALTLLALLHGNGNIKNTIVIAANCGWDADCTAATAGALVGAMVGASGLPKDWVELMGESLTCDVNVRHKHSLLTDFATDTCKVGIELSHKTNGNVHITDTPEEIANAVIRRMHDRPARESIDITSMHPGDPALYRDKTSEVVLMIENRAATEARGRLTVAPVNSDISISPNDLCLSIPPNDTQRVTLHVCHDASEGMLRDKNLLEAKFEIAGKPVAQHVFGFPGSRQWFVYGPYWDAWDTTRWEVCPYRNDEKECHPIFVSGCHTVCTNQFVRLDKPYLDETELAVHDLPDETPVLLQRGEDHIDAEHLGGFFGEACYYFVREIACDEDREFDLDLGCTSPCVVWIDGREVWRSESSRAWCISNHIFRVRFGPKPSRMVIKCAKSADEFRMSVTPIRLSFSEEKRGGVSYILDNMRDVKLDTGC